MSVGCLGHVFTFVKQSKKTAAFSEMEAEDYNDMNKCSQLIYGKKLLDMLNLDSAEHVLAVGCGTGQLAAYVAESKVKKRKVSAFDPDTERIKWAKRQYSNIDNLSFYEGTALQFLEDKRDQYDVIYSNVVLHWIKPEERLPTFEAMFKALKPGGITAHQMSTKLPKTLEHLSSFVLDKHKFKMLWDSLCFFTMPDLKELIEKSGFEVICVEEVIEKSRFPSMEEYLRWFESTLHGRFLVKDKYYKNQDKIGLNIKEDGSIIEETSLLRAILRKPNNC